LLPNVSVVTQGDADVIVSLRLIRRAARGKSARTR
jgi:hypothetical protein